MQKKICRNCHRLINYLLRLLSSDRYEYIVVSISTKIHIFVDHCLATKVFIGKLPATARGWVIIQEANDKRGHWANKVVIRLNWGAFDHASHAPHLRSDNYYIYSED